MSSSLSYTKIMLLEPINEMEKVYINEDFNTDNEAGAVCSLTDGEIAEMGVNQGDCNNREEEDVAISTAENCLQVAR